MKVDVVSVSGQQFYANSQFPFCYASLQSSATLEDTLAWIKQSQRHLLQLASLHGAVLLRGFPLATAEDFDAVMGDLLIENFPYKKSLSNAVRINRTERVFSANEAPPEVQIFFHHEMAQTPLFPKWIAFFCELAAEQGGATPICRSDMLYERLNEQCPDFIRQCERLGLRYTNTMPATDDAKSGMGRSWRSTLAVETKEAAESRLRDLNYSWEWVGDECLRATTPPLPAVMKMDDGRKTFFNQLIAAFCGWKDDRNDPSKAISHGDGSTLDVSSVKTAIRLADELAFDLKLHAGDMVLIDNTLVMHARRTFVGKRKVLASLAEMHRHAFQLV
jgi:alpha-ketoglutarate-dependent taurine dioxygenase